MQLQIISRVLAIFLISLALGGLVFALDRQEAQLLDELTTREDLLAYVKSYHFNSYWMNSLVVLLAGFAYVGLVEGLALLVRVLTKRKAETN